MTSNALAPSEEPATIAVISISPSTNKQLIYTHIVTGGQPHLEHAAKARPTQSVKLRASNQKRSFFSKKTQSFPNRLVSKPIRSKDRPRNDRYTTEQVGCAYQREREEPHSQSTTLVQSGRASTRITNSPSTTDADREPNCEHNIGSCLKKIVRLKDAWGEALTAVPTSAPTSAIAPTSAPAVSARPSNRSGGGVSRRRVVPDAIPPPAGAIDWVLFAAATTRALQAE
ncbi:hypothetical protein EDB87DRAFT_1649694 [Lactarius vividus]|nr:hypothetical protein EDB87DRAFT_1649694 [Lactarius vividus]